MKYSAVVWDFNGTILDDIDAAIASVNDMLRARGGREMSREWYYELVETPIIRFYQKIPELRVLPAETIYREFGEGYARHSGLIRPADGARETLESLRNAGVRQIVLSSFERGVITDWLAKLDMAQFFEAVLGADDNRSEGKERRGMLWGAQNGVCRGNAVLIGDTGHDYDAALAMDIDCVLVTYGHQSRAQLEKLGVPLISNLGDLLPVLDKM